MFMILEMLSSISAFFGGIIAHKRASRHRVRIGSSKEGFMRGIDNRLKSRFFEDPDTAAVCGSIMGFAKGLRGFDFARCARNESHAAVSDIKF